MKKVILYVLFSFFLVSYSQDSITEIKIGTDSADYFLQKGLQEKQNGKAILLHYDSYGCIRS